MRFDISGYVGRRIRQRRLFMGMTRGGLAKAIGVGLTQAQKYENGVSRVTASRLWDIAQALDTTPAYFFPERELDRELDALLQQDKAGDKEAALVLQFFERMSQPQREAFLEMAMSMKEEEPD